MGRLGKTWTLYKQSFNVLCADDAEIVFFPVMSVISAILVAAGFFYPLFRNGIFEGQNPENIPWGIYALMFIWYFLNYFVVIFFNSALVGCANMRLSGGDPKVRDGLRIAVQHLNKMACSAFGSATVGVILDMLKNKGNRIIDRLVAGGLSLAWR